MELFFAKPSSLSYKRFDYDGKACGGNNDPTKGAMLTTSGDTTEFITVMWPNSSMPTCSSITGGVMVGSDVIIFDDPVEGSGNPVVTVNGTTVLSSSDVDLERPQGYGYLDLGRDKWDGRLFIPEVGYPMGEVPEWLLAQRVPGYTRENTDCTVTGVKKETKLRKEERTNIKLWPNPADETVTIQASNMNYGENSSVIIRNSQGVIVKSSQIPSIDSSLNNLTFDIGISDLPGGFYILQMNNRTIKFIKQ
jgi:hypothetical protein